MQIDEIVGADSMETDQSTAADRKLSRLDSQRRPMVARLWIFLVGFCLALASLQAWNVWAAYVDQVEETGISTANMTRALAAQAESVLKVGDAVLSEMVERVEHDGTGGAAGARLHARLLGLSMNTPGIHGLFVYGPAGDWRVTHLAQPMNANNTDREYFQYHLHHTDRAIHIGKPVRSRSTGALIIPLSRRIDNPDGSFNGVAMVSLRVDFFGKFYDGFDVGRTGTIVLTNDDGTMVYRRPFDERLVGTVIPNGPVIRMLHQYGPVGTRWAVSQIDHVERLYSYRHLDNFPMVVASALARDELLTDWRRQAMITSGAVFLAIVLVLVGGGRIVRQIRVRDQLEERLREASEALRSDNASLQNLADSDGLTGLANRRAFEACLAREYERARRSGTAFSVVLFDIDNFKKYNDHYGHVAGDDCLRRVATVVGTAPRRPADLAARYGGEEFALILPDTDLAGATAVAEKLRESVAALELAHADTPLGRVSASLGVYTGYPRSAARSDPLAWVEAADQQLYEAKAAGRNRVVARQGT